MAKAYVTFYLRNSQPLEREERRKQGAVRSGRRAWYAGKGTEKARRQEKRN